MSRVVQLPAPGRGAYDRSLSRSERHAEHRERLLLATAEVFREGAPTVARIVERAGVSRSTFYEFFDSPEHVLSHLEQRALSVLEAAFSAAQGQARTPLERVRALVRAWLDVLGAQRTTALVALTRRADPQQLSAASRTLLKALTSVATQARLEGAGSLAAADDVTLLAATAALEAVTLHHLSEAAVPDAARALSDIISRLLR